MKVGKKIDVLKRRSGSAFVDRYTMALSWKPLLVAAVLLRAAAAQEEIEAVELSAEAPEVTVAPASSTAVSLTYKTARKEAKHIRDVVKCAKW